MSRSLEMPAFLDERGQALWTAFITTSEQARATQRELRRLTPSMRKNIRPGQPEDPEITLSYQAAVTAADEAKRAQRVAEREYHAHRRSLLASQYRRRHSAAVTTENTASSRMLHGSSIKARLAQPSH